MFFSKCTDAVRKPAWCFLALLSTTGSLSCSSRGVKVFRWELFHLPQHLYCPKSTWEQIYNRKRKDCVVMCCLQCGRWARNLEGDGMTPLPGHVCSDTTTEITAHKSQKFWHRFIGAQFWLNFLTSDETKRFNLFNFWMSSEIHFFFNLPVSSCSMKCRSW